MPIIRSWALTRGFALHPGTRNRYEIRYTRTQHRPPSRQVNDHGRVSGTHRVDSGVVEDLPDRGRSETVAEPRECAVDVAVAPSRILSCEAQCESAKLSCRRWPARRSLWLGPVLNDAVPMPTQQRVGGDQPPCPARSRERGRDRCEQAAVGVGDLGSVDLAAQHSELVARHDDLKVLPAA